MKTRLFTPIKIRDIEFRNRIFVSPMCQYSAKNGLPQTWHLVHLGSRAVGGAGLVMAEATAVSPEGRISPSDTGIWNDDQVEAWRPITSFISQQGAIPAIQIAHAGRKASTSEPWNGDDYLTEIQGGWIPLGPSPIPFEEGATTPREMSLEQIENLVEQYERATDRALAAGFKVLEIHMAHGYLHHEFLSPLSNHRKDEFGGSLENRMRFSLQVAKRVRARWPLSLPLLVRISCTDWVDGGWDALQSVELSKRLKATGVDLIDCSSGGNIPDVKIPVSPGYQVPFSKKIRAEAGVLTGAVGLITEAAQAERILENGEADVIFIARELLRDPYFPLHAAKVLGEDIPWPNPYLRAKR